MIIDRSETFQKENCFLINDDLPGFVKISTALIVFKLSCPSRLPLLNFNVTFNALRNNTDNKDIYNL